MADITQILTYSFTLALAAILPGAGMTGLMFRTLTQGHYNGLIMLMGLITGDLIFLASAIFLIGYVGKINQSVLSYFIILASFYLLYLAYAFWSFKGNLFDNTTASMQAGKVFSAYRDGVLITLSNPKTMSFYLAIVPVIFDSHTVQQQGYIVAIITILTLFFIGSLYIFLAVNLKNWIADIKIQRILLKSLAVMMCVLALSMLFK